MKTTLITLFMVWSLLALPQDHGNSETIYQNKPAKYPYTSAAISYVVTGDAIGTSTLVFDRNGWRSVFTKEITFKRYGMETSEVTKDLVDGDYKFSINIDSKKGKKEIDRNWSSLISYKENPEIVKAIMESRGAELLKTDTLLNLPCRIWVFENGTTEVLWEYSGIPLRIEKRLPGFSYVIEATEINEAEGIKPDVFLLQEGISWD